MNSRITELRAELSQVDTEILRLLEMRCSVTDQIGVVKKDTDAPVECLGVESHKLSSLSAATDVLTSGEVGMIFSGIIRVSRTRQYFLRVPA